MPETVPAPPTTTELAQLETAHRAAADTLEAARTAAIRSAAAWVAALVRTLPAPAATLTLEVVADYDTTWLRPDALLGDTGEPVTGSAELTAEIDAAAAFTVPLWELGAAVAAGRATPGEVLHLDVATGAVFQSSYGSYDGWDELTAG